MKKYLIKHLSGRNHFKESYSVPQAICSDQYYYYHSFRRSIQSSNESFHQRARVYAKALQDRDANIRSSSL